MNSVLHPKSLNLYYMWEGKGKDKEKEEEKREKGNKNTISE